MRKLKLALLLAAAISVGLALGVTRAKSQCGQSGPNYGTEVYCWCIEGEQACAPDACELDYCEGGGCQPSGELYICIDPS